MSYCYRINSKGYAPVLKPIQKLIPKKYLLFKCLLDKKINFFNPESDDLLIYSEKGLLNQLDLFKAFQDKFDFIYNKQYGYIFVLKNMVKHKKNICIALYFDIYQNTHNDIENNVLNIGEHILKKYKKSMILNMLIYDFIRKYNMKISSTLNYKQEFEYKRKKLINSKEITQLKTKFNLDYVEAKKIITEITHDKKFEKYYKANLKKFKTKSFAKEIKEVKNSIFFTCKVSTKYKKLFPK
jgi:hypothetical protein